MIFQNYHQGFKSKLLAKEPRKSSQMEKYASLPILALYPLPSHSTAEDSKPVLAELKVGERVEAHMGGKMR
jgi:hypothetical protein